MLLTIDRESKVPLYNQISTQLQDMIVRGVLKVGDRLPANRDLAKTLGVNRSTVTAAYDDLIADGVITSRVGSGTYVSMVPAGTGYRSETGRRRPSPLFWSALLADRLHEEKMFGFLNLQTTKKAVQLSYSLPCSTLAPLEEFRRSVNRVLRNEASTILEMGCGEGYEPLIKQVVAYMARIGVAVEPDEILITTGCQQSVDLIRRLLTNPGDEVVLENPTYPGVLSVYTGGRYKTIGVPVGPKGMDLDVLEDVLEQRRPRLIYVVPSFHNPTGVTMDISSRRRLLELSARFRVPIIEDDIFSELRYEGASIPSLKAMDEFGFVIYINSFSKIGFPGIRLGWVVAPKIVIDSLRALKERSDKHVSLLSQAAIADFIAHGQVIKHINRSKRSYADRRDVMIQALERYFPDGSSWTKPDGGMSIWVTLPESVNTGTLLPKALENGVAYIPGEYFYVCSAKYNTMRLSFTTVDSPRIEQAIKKLGALIKNQISENRIRTDVSRPVAGAVIV